MQKPHNKSGNRFLSTTLFTLLFVCAQNASSEVNATTNYALTGEEMDLQLVEGSPARMGVGNAHANIIIGNSLSNVLFGHSNDDTLRGGTGDDVQFGGFGNDTLEGFDGDDLLVGNDGDDHLSGGSGDDLLVGNTPTTFSGIMTVLREAGNIKAWLAAPTISYLEADVRFSADMPEDVVFGMDQEFLEGGLDPLRFAGVDWMAILGIARNGLLVVRVGGPEQLNGIPSVVSNWETFDLGITLQPDTWYRIRSEVNFDTLEFVNFKITGPGIDVTQDISGLNVTYEEFLPSDVPALTFFMWAARLPTGIEHNEGLPLVEFDNVRAGFDYQGQIEWALDSGFDLQETIPTQPRSENGFELTKYTEGHWYLERIGAAAWIEQSATGKSGMVVALGEYDQPGGSDSDTLDGGPGEDILFGGPDNDLLMGGADKDSLSGGDGDDRLEAGAGNDTLQGGKGVDILLGGPGDDLYELLESDLGDTIEELPGEGDDRIETWITYTLPDNTEKLLIHESAGAIDGSGNDLDNFILGNNDANTLEGFGGNDNLRGEGGADILDGGPGNDTLDGGRGNDIMKGGPGDDQYTVEDAGDSIEELVDSGFDSVFTVVTYTLAPNIESLSLYFGVGPINGTGNALNNTIQGNEFANILHGGAGDDWIDGFFGVDTLYGGPGDDTFLVDDEDDQALELANEGFDQVVATVSHALSLNVERLVLKAGAGPINGVGNIQDNAIIGNESMNTLIGDGGNDILQGEAGVDILLGGDGDDTLDGGSDADTLSGQAGNDLYLIDNTGDAVLEALDNGYDQVISSVSYEMEDNIELLVLSEEAGAISGTGNEIDNYIAGNISANVLLGLDGNDVLIGNNGADTLEGGAGSDVLSGNAAFDGNFDGQTDKFLYKANDIGDTIVGFDTRAPSAGGDIIDMSELYAQLIAPQINVDTESFPGNCVVNLTDGGNSELIILVIGISNAAELDDNITF